MVAGSFKVRLARVTFDMTKTEYELPLIWNWTSGQNGGTGTAQPTPTWQRERIEQDGWPIMPHAEFRGTREWADPTCGAYTTPACLTAKETGRPLAFVGDNVLNLFSKFGEFTDHQDPNDADSHAWYIKSNGEDPPTTTLKNLSPYSSLTPSWARRLGYLLGTCEQVVESAKLYPYPPFVIFFDNNEAVFDWRNVSSPDIRELGMVEITKLREWWAEYEQNNDPDTTEFSAVKERIDLVFEGVYENAKRMIWLHFNRGFSDGLATHNTHWSRVAKWCAYSGIGSETTEHQRYNVFGTDKPFLERKYSDSFSIQGHQYGVTGEIYANPWYGGWHRDRFWKLIDSVSERYRAACEQHGTASPLNVMLLWEGKDIQVIDKPPRDEWRAIVRTALWMRRAELAGHFASSSTATNSDSIQVYYDEVRRAAEEVRRPEFIDFWKHGELLRSIDPSTTYKQHCTPMWVNGFEWHYQHVVEQDRYSTDIANDPRLNEGESVDEARRFLISVRRSDDRFRKDLSSKQPVNIACWAVRLGTQVLLFIAGINGAVETPVTIKLNDDGLIRDIVAPSAPTGGQFHIYDSATQLLTAVEA